MEGFRKERFVLNILLLFHVLLRQPIYVKHIDKFTYYQQFYI